PRNQGRNVLGTGPVRPTISIRGLSSAHGDKGSSRTTSSTSCFPSAIQANQNRIRTRNANGRRQGLLTTERVGGSKNIGTWNHIHQILGIGSIGPRIGIGRTSTGNRH